MGFFIKSIVSYTFPFITYKKYNELKPFSLESLIFPFPTLTVLDVCVFISQHV